MPRKVLLGLLHSIERQRLVRPWLAPLCIFLLAAGLHWTTLEGGFVWDDRAAVLDNADINADQPWSSLLHHDFWGQDITLPGSHKSFRPLTTATYRWNRALAPSPLFAHGSDSERSGSEHASGLRLEEGSSSGCTRHFHLTNVCLHALACVLVLLLVRRVFAVTPVPGRVSTLARRAVGGPISRAEPTKAAAAAAVGDSVAAPAAASAPKTRAGPFPPAWEESGCEPPRASKNSSSTSRNSSNGQKLGSSPSSPSTSPRVVRLQETPAVLSSLLFTVHPAHVEAVAPLVGRADVLCGLLSLAALLLAWPSPHHTRQEARDQGDGEGKGKGKGEKSEEGGEEGIAAGCWWWKWWYGRLMPAVKVCLSLGLPVLATLCKEVGVTTFGVLLCGEALHFLRASLWPMQEQQEQQQQQQQQQQQLVIQPPKRDMSGQQKAQQRQRGAPSGLCGRSSWWRVFWAAVAQHSRREGLVCLLLRMGALVGLTIGVVLSHVALHGSSLLRPWGVLENDIAILPLKRARLLSYAHTHVRYAWLLLWPQRLCYDWGWACLPRIEEWADWRNGLAVVLYAAALWAVVMGLRLRHFPLLWGMVMLLVPFLPAAQLFFPVGTVLAERLLYLPSVGACVLAGCVLYDYRGDADVGEGGEGGKGDEEESKEGVKRWEEEKNQDETVVSKGEQEQGEGEHEGEAEEEGEEEEEEEDDDDEVLAGEAILEELEEENDGSETDESETDPQDEKEDEDGEEEQEEEDEEEDEEKEKEKVRSSGQPSAPSTVEQQDAGGKSPHQLVVQPSRPPQSQGSLRLLLLVLLLAWAVHFGVRTYRRCGEWRSERALFEAALLVCPSGVKTLNNLAMLKLTPFEAGEAAQLLDRALQIYPTFEVAQYNRGLAARLQRDSAAAIEHLELSLRPVVQQQQQQRQLDPSSDPSSGGSVIDTDVDVDMIGRGENAHALTYLAHEHLLLVTKAAGLGALDDAHQLLLIAEGYLERSLGPSPRYLHGQHHQQQQQLLVIQQEAGEGGGRTDEGQGGAGGGGAGGQALPLAWYCRAMALAFRGGFAEAVRSYVEAAHRNAGMAVDGGDRMAFEDIYNQMGLAAKDGGLLDVAAEAFATGLLHEPDSLALLVNAGVAYQDKQDLVTARSLYSRALQQEPSSPELLNNVGYLQELLGELEEARALYARAIEVMDNEGGDAEGRAGAHPQMRINLKNVEARIAANAAEAAAAAAAAAADARRSSTAARM